MTTTSNLEVCYISVASNVLTQIITKDSINADSIHMLDQNPPKHVLCVRAAGRPEDEVFFDAVAQASTTAEEDLSQDQYVYVLEVTVPSVLVGTDGEDGFDTIYLKEPLSLEYVRYVYRIEVATKLTLACPGGEFFEKKRITLPVGFSRLPCIVDTDEVLEATKQLQLAGIMWTPAHFPATNTPSLFGRVKVKYTELSATIDLGVWLRTAPLTDIARALVHGPHTCEASNIANYLRESDRDCMAMCLLAGTITTTLSGIGYPINGTALLVEFDLDAVREFMTVVNPTKWKSIQLYMEKVRTSLEPNE